MKQFIEFAIACMCHLLLIQVNAQQVDTHLYGSVHTANVNIKVIDTNFGTTLNEIDIKTGRTVPKINANNYLSQKMIIYKGNLYYLKKRRDSGNYEVSFIEKTKVK